MAVLTCNWHFLLLSAPPALLAMFCWLLTIFLLGLAFGLSEGGRLARLVTFLTDDPVEEAMVVGGWAGAAVEPAAAATEVDEAAAAAAAATLFRLKCTMSSNISVALI